MLQVVPMCSLLASVELAARAIWFLKFSREKAVARVDTSPTLFMDQIKLDRDDTFEDDRIELYYGIECYKRTNLRK